MRGQFQYNNTIINPEIISFTDGCYFRDEGKDHTDMNYNYLDNILGYTFLLTDDYNFMKHTEDYILRHFTEGSICLCGCDKCNNLFIVEHLPTSTKFAVGSSCISKYYGKKMKGDLKKNVSNELCLECGEPLYFKTSEYSKKNAYRNQPGFCETCWNN